MLHEDGRQLEVLLVVLHVRERALVRRIRPRLLGHIDAQECRNALQSEMMSNGVSMKIGRFLTDSFKIAFIKQEI